VRKNSNGRAEKLHAMGRGESLGRDLKEIPGTLEGGQRIWGNNHGVVGPPGGGGGRGETRNKMTGDGKERQSGSMVPSKGPGWKKTLLRGIFRKEGVKRKNCIKK